MKNTFYKLHIRNTEPLTTEEIELMRPYLLHFTDRLIVDEKDNHTAFIIVSSEESGNPDKDEVSIFIDCVDDWGNAIVFFGYPNDDLSNGVGDISDLEVWKLLDNCIVDDPRR